MLAELKKISYGFEDVPVLEEIEASVSEGDRIGLVGTNGAGKTTLLSLLVGERTPDEGEVFLKSGLRLGYLKQGSGLDSQRTVLAEMREVFSDLWACEARMREIERAFAGLDHQSPEYRRLAGEYERCNAFFAANDGYGAEVRIRTVLGGMGFSGREDQQISTMSGGEKTRLALCKLLLQPLELLILDEPTNHLDLGTLQWLEGFLEGWKGALLIVSHDRYFLDRTVRTIWDLENKKLKTYRGNYSKYKMLKAEWLEHAQKEYEKQQVRIAAMTDYVARNIVRATTAKSAKSRVHQLENMEKLEKPYQPPAQPQFSFDYDQEPVKEVLSVRHLPLKAGEKLLAAEVSMELRRGEKAALVGPNGAGKSTFLKTLMKSANFPTPGVLWGKNVRLSYYDQENLNLNRDNTVLEELWNRFPVMDQTRVRSILARLTLTGEEVYKKVGVLSGGERAKLGFAIMIAERGNTLILDEPTNHLDLEGREALERALKNFPGTLFFVSHDRYFLNAVADRVIELDEGKMTPYQGNYDDYLSQKEGERRAEAAEREARAVREKPKGSYRSPKQRAEEVRLKQAVKDCEKKIADLEAEQEALNADIADPETARDFSRLRTACERLEAVKTELESLYAEWEDLLSRLE